MVESQPSAQGEASGDGKSRRRLLRLRALTVLGATLALGGLALGSATAMAPEATEKIYGETKVRVQELTRDVAATVQEAVTEEKVYPQVALGISGYERDLDRCDGTFTEMLSYQGADIPPVWAAHNKCGGDIILPWELGTELQLAGDPTVYEIVDIRHVPQTWSTTDDLLGLQGDLVLQTCFYGENRMKFAVLRAVG